MMAAEGGDKDSDWNLTGFLFGNINEKGELEDETILDEVGCKRLRLQIVFRYFCKMCPFFQIPIYVQRNLRL